MKKIADPIVFHFETRAHSIILASPNPNLTFGFMISTTCSNCHNGSVPINETAKIDGQVYCKECLDTHFSDKEKLAGKLVEKQHDPTICAFCNLDDGLPLNKISDFPVCSACEIKVHNRTFPTWVKAFFGGVLLIVVFSFFWNWKYYQAYNAINQSTHYLNEGNLQKAFAFMSDASKKVP